MSRKKRMQSVREAKDRRAKKIAIGGGVVLALLLAWEVPHFLGGKKAAAPAPATTTASGTTAPERGPLTATSFLQCGTSVSSNASSVAVGNGS